MIALERPFIVFGKPDLGERETEALSIVLKSGWLGNGPITKNFEKAFTNYIGKDFYSIAVSSCTMGLYLSLKAEGIKQGDEVITSPLTFAATVNAILATGATPVFVDVDSDGCLDPSRIPDKVNKDTKAIIPVHLGGHPCDMSGIIQKAAKYKLKVIEDTAHGFGGTYLGSPLGSIGDYGVFSFYPTKNITSGDGGMIVTKDKEKAEKIRLMASQGLSDGAWMRYGSGKINSYEIAMPGFKGLMNDLNASLGLVQLERWPEMKDKRIKIWNIYQDAFGRRAVGHSTHLYIVLVEDRNEMRRKLNEKGIGTGIHYNPLHLERGYSFLGYRMGDFPVAEKMGLNSFSLPISSTMTDEDANYVVQSIREILKED